MITLTPTTSRFYYFAQLENEGGRPLSAPLALDPSAAPTRAAAPPSSARCADAQRLITLTAEGHAELAPAPAEARRSRGSSPRPAPTARTVDDEAESSTAGR